MQHRHTILLGGIGGDSHSVGLTILRQSLTMHGFEVVYLGIQSQLEDIFQLAGFFNIVMISNMDGHAAHYLRHFPELKKAYNCEGTRWYLGGNIHISDASENERFTQHFMEMGFDRAFVKFVEIQSVLAAIENDLAGVEPKIGYIERREREHYFGGLAMTVSDATLEPDVWDHLRLEVLEHWKTGHKAKDIVDNAEFLGRQASLPFIQTQVAAGQVPILIQPRSGVPLPKEQIKAFTTFKRHGVQVLSYQVDSLTRNCDYARIEEILRQSSNEQDLMLNGFPVVNHGVPTLRQISTLLNVPLQVRHSTRDPRLLAEISYAGGITAFEGGCICYNIPYYKDYLLNDSIKNWQYVDYLTGMYYQKFGIALDREFFGVLTGTLIPPCLALVTDVLEAIMAVQQGVKCVSLGYAEQGNRIQDVAAIRVLHKVAREILDNLGYKDVQVNTVFSQYMAAFPQDEQYAKDLIYQSAITAALSGATRVIIKTPVEAYKIPTLEDNLLGLGLAQQGVKDSTFEILDQRSLAIEEEIITHEFYDIFDSVVFCGHGSFTNGIIQAFFKGYLDIPFSPSIHNKGNVITARDVSGAVRFADVGALQLSNELREFHREKLQVRRAHENGMTERQSYLLVEKDVLQITRNQYARWPLDR